MSRTRMIFLGLLGAAFLLSGQYVGSDTRITYDYLGIGTWTAGIIYYTLFPKYKEVASFILGLLILHAGVLLLIRDISNPKLLGALVFTGGIVMVMSSGLSDFMNKKKVKKRYKQIPR